MIGEGGWHLLRHIIRLGSLAAAARHIGWSYRHAWGYLRAAEGVLGTPVTDPIPGRVLLVGLSSRRKGMLS